MKTARYNQKYDWDRLFAKQRFALRRGRDYACSQSTMAQQIRNEAVRRDLYVQIVEDRSSITAIVSDQPMHRRKKHHSNGNGRK